VVQRARPAAHPGAAHEINPFEAGMSLAPEGAEDERVEPEPEAAADQRREWSA
jgi:hypothetical protein